MLRNKIRQLSFNLMSYILIGILVVPSQAFADKTKYYRFSNYIYEQDDKIKELKRLSPHISEGELNEELKKEVKKRKKDELYKNCLKRIEKNIEELKRQIPEAKRGEFRKKLIENLKSTAATFPVVGMLFGGLAGPAGAGAGAAVGVGIGFAALAIATVAEPFIEKQVNKSIISQTDPHDIIKEMREFQKELKKLKQGLKEEPVLTLEEKYVEQKRHMEKDLQVEIERSLIQARVADYFFQINTPAIGYALGLPLRPKALLDLNNLDKSKEELIERFEKAPSFSVYTKDTKRRLLNFIFRIAVNSVTDTNSESPLRVVEHWLGTGSTGKSTAAKEIARFLGLPYFEKRITSPETEINTTNISGAIRSFQGAPNIGWLAEALLQKVKEEEKTYENALLILDDFPVNTQTAQNTLLAITDPEKRTFFNEYLQTNLNISRLNILIISNDDFQSLRPIPPSNNSTSDIDHGYTALRSRFGTTVFPEFTVEQKGELAKPYLKETLVRKYSPPSFYRFKYEDPTTIMLEYDSQALSDMGLESQNYPSILIPTGISQDKSNSITIRELKRVLEEKLNSYLIKLFKERTKYFRKGWKWLVKEDTDTKNSHIDNGIWLFKQAALRGHPKALDILEALKNVELTKEILILEQKVEGRVGDLEQQKRNSAKVAEFYTTKLNIKKMKEWWGKAHQLKSHVHSYLICNHLIGNGNKIDFNEEDYRLLNMLQKHEGIDYNLSRSFREPPITIGGALLTIGEAFQKNSSNPSPKQFDIARECFTASARLGNNEAPESLYRLGRELEDMQGPWNQEAITCYKEAANKNYLLARYKMDDLSDYKGFIEDIWASKNSFLISGFKYAELREQNNGVMTLCFERREGATGDAALAFEMFFPNKPWISLRMIRYKADSYCGGKREVHIEHEKETLKSVHRKRKLSDSDESKGELPSPYVKYASWIVPNKMLIRALNQAETDIGSKEFYTGTKYITNIMKSIDIQPNFGKFQLETPANLKSLIDNGQITPEPNRTTYTTK